MGSADHPRGHPSSDRSHRGEMDGSRAVRSAPAWPLRALPGLEPLSESRMVLDPSILSLGTAGERPGSRAGSAIYENERFRIAANYT